MKGIYYFLVLCAYVLGAVGGFGWCAYNRAWLIVIGIVALAAMAFPYAKRAFKYLKDGE